MRIGNSKYVLFKFIPYEYKSLEKYLEKMALKGWLLKNIFGYYLKFVKCQPKNLKYTVGVVDKISFFVGKDSDESMEYREYCEAAGWNFVCERDKIQVYCKENEINVPIQTNEQEKYNSVFKASLKYIILDLITALMLLYSQYTITFGSYSADFLVDNTRLLSFLMIFLWNLLAVTQLIHFSIWSIRAKKSLRVSGNVNYTFRYITNIKLLFSKLIFILASLVILLAMLVLGELFAVAVFIIAISIYLGVFIKGFTDESSYSNLKKKTIFIGGILVIVLVNLMIMPKLLFLRVGSVNFAIGSDNKGYTVTLEDFNDVSIESDFKYAKKKVSPLASMESYIDKGGNVSISYDLYKSKYSSIIKYALNKEIYSFKKFNDDVIEINTDFSEDIKVYEVKDNDNYILASENSLIRIYIEDNKLNRDEILNIIYEEVFD